MNSGKKTVLVFIFYLIFACDVRCDCLKIIPERASVTYVNEAYFSNMSVTVRRISRGGDYVASLQFVSKSFIGHNVMIDLIFYQYLHNEFRRSFVEMHFEACDLVLRDPYVGKVLRKAGLTTCPIPPGQISLKNVNLSTDIPSVWPFEKGKMEVITTDNSTGFIMATGEIVLTFKQK